METEQKITPKLILSFIIAVIVIVSGLFVASTYFQFNIGSNVYNIFQGSDNSQVTPPAAAITPPNPTSTFDGDNTDKNTATTPPTGTLNPTPTSSQQSTPQATATPATELPLGTSVSGSITTTTNSNRYRVVLPEAGRLTVKITANSPTSTYSRWVYVRWYNSAGSRMGSTDIHSFLSSSYNKYLDLEAGTYYIEIAKYSDSDTYTGAYTLSTTFVVAGNNDAEPNNTRETAQTIAAGQTVIGFLSYQDDTDFYKIDLTQAGRLTVKITANSPTSTYSRWVYVRWYNSAGSRMGSTDIHSFLSSSYNKYLDLEAGTYYIEIAKYSDSDTYTGAYTLTASVSYF